MYQAADRVNAGEYGYLVNHSALGYGFDREYLPRNTVFQFAPPSMDFSHVCSTLSGANRTTVTRFQTEAGMTCSKWREQLRPMHGMKLLAEGENVTHAALEAGYCTPSAFISMFRKALGTTPGS